MPREDQQQNPGTPRSGISNRLTPTEEAAERREHQPHAKPNQPGGTKGADAGVAHDGPEGSDEVATERGE